MAPPLSLPSREKIGKAKILVVGAGGIGCELLKDLVLSGFRTIEIIDLDTIDVSNLNRQFLFRREHVGRPKADVARESVLRVAPDIDIKAYHASVFEERFGVSWVKGFDIVLNALDNIKARKHMNRLCMASGVPLLDSGTGGYSGQSSVHIKDKYECYDCNPPPPPKQFPVCTIRDTPDKIEHCVAWAKNFFGVLFGPEADDSNILQDLAKAKSEGENPSPSLRWVSDSAETAVDYAFRVFEKTFVSNIKDKAALWKSETKTPPQPIEGFEKHQAATAKPHDGTNKRTIAESQKKQSLEESFALFMTCIRGMVESRHSEIGGASFDKDDELAMDFVLAVSNLRAHAYQIEKESHFKVKEIAGSIIPAIATTNAIAAGLMVIEAFKLLEGSYDECKQTIISEKADRPLQAHAMDAPKPSCCVCNTGKPLECHVDTTKMTVGGFIEKVLKNHIGFNKPGLMKGDSLLYDAEDEEDYVDVLGKAMNEYHLKHDVVVSVDDSSQGLAVEVIIVHKEGSTADGEDADQFTVVGQAESKAVKVKDDWGYCGKRDQPEKENGSVAKRARTEVTPEEDDRTAKRVRIEPEAPAAAESDDDIVIL